MGAALVRAQMRGFDRLLDIPKGEETNVCEGYVFFTMPVSY
jgi:hypothetical protein